MENLAISIYPKFRVNKKFTLLKIMCIVFVSGWFDYAFNVVWSVGNVSEPKTIIIGSKKNKAMERKK